MNSERLRNIRNIAMRTAVAGALAFGLSPRIIEAQSGCNPVVVGPFDGNSPDPEKRTVRAGNSVVQLEVWAPTYGLGNDPVQTILDRQNTVAQYQPNAHGIGWVYGENCPVDQVVGIMDRSGRRYVELGEVYASRALVQLEADPILGNTSSGQSSSEPVSGASQPSETQERGVGEEECEVIASGIVTPDRRESATILVQGSVVRVQVYGPHKGVDPLVNSLIDRGYLKVAYAPAVTGAWWKYNVGCPIFNVAETIGNDKYEEFGELVRKGALEVSPDFNAPRG